MTTVTFDNAQDLDGFDSTGSDKLVVTLSHEHGEILEVRYGELKLKPAVASPGNQGSLTSIWYLDKPQGKADLSVRCSAKTNGIGGCVLALTRTAPGGPDDSSVGSGKSFRIHSGTNGLVIASLSMNSSEMETKGDVPPPLNKIYYLPTGSNWGGAGYMWIRPDGWAEGKFLGDNDTSSVGVAVFAPDHEH